MKKDLRVQVIVGVVACMVWAVSCSEAETDQRPEKSSSEKSSLAEGEWSELPSLFGRYCDGMDEPPGTCEWVASNDAVVLVTVDEVSFIDEWKPNHAGAEHVDECESGTAAIELDVSVEETLFGEAPAELTATIGGDASEIWTVAPLVDDGEFLWSDASTDDELIEADSPPIAEGQLLGLALHHDEERDRWATLGERLFVQAEGDGEDEYIVEFQESAAEDLCGKGRLVPEELDGAEVGAFRESIGDCSTSDASDARAEHVEDSFEDATWVDVGRCYSTEPPSSSEDCASSADCEDGMRCVDSDCVESD